MQAEESFASVDFLRSFAVSTCERVAFSRSPQLEVPTSTSGNSSALFPKGNGRAADPQGPRDGPALDLAPQTPGGEGVLPLADLLCHERCAQSRGEGEKGLRGAGVVRPFSRPPPGGGGWLPSREPKTGAGAPGGPRGGS